MRFGDNRTKAPAAKMAAHLRDKTERTWTIAAFGDLDESVMARRRQHTRRRFIVEVRRALIAERDHRKRSRVNAWIANREDVVNLAGADEGIDLRHLCLQLIAITLNQT